MSQTDHMRAELERKLMQHERTQMGMAGQDAPYPAYVSKAPAIFAAMCAVMGDLDAIGKTSENKAQGFKFRGIDQVYNALNPLLSKHKIFTCPTVLDVQSEERETRSGGKMIYRIATIRYRFYCVDGSFVDATVVGEGADSGDKAMNKAMAIAHKYALFQVFTIPTEDMPDPDAESVQLAPKKPSAPAYTSPLTKGPKV